MQSVPAHCEGTDEFCRQMYLTLCRHVPSDWDVPVNDSLKNIAVLQLIKMLDTM